MARLLILHWKSGDAKAAVTPLRTRGHTVRAVSPEGPEGIRPLLARPPDAFIIDLGRRPSNGTGVGVLLRQRKATRNVPLIFAGGERTAVAGARKVLPDATYATWGRVATAVNKALDGAKKRRHSGASKGSGSKKMAVPGTMDGYSGTPLVRKLGIRAGLDVVLLGAPKDFERTLGDLPDGARLRRQARGKANLVILFTKSSAELKKRLPTARKLAGTNGNMWLAWPKKTSGVPTDLNFDEVQKAGLKTGMVDFKVCAIDATWSGLRFGQKKT